MRIVSLERKRWVGSWFGAGPLRMRPQMSCFGAISGGGVEIAPAAAMAPLATCEKSRRVSPAEDIVVTFLSLPLLRWSPPALKPPGTPEAAAGRPRPVPGKRDGAIQRRSIGTLAEPAQAR